jgi:hypothetical protein
MIWIEMEGKSVEQFCEASSFFSLNRIEFTTEALRTLRYT